MELLFELEAKEKASKSKQKQVDELKRRSKTIKLEMKNVQGPLEGKACHTLEFDVGLRGDVWSGNCIGPDMMSFLQQPDNANIAAKFQQLLLSIKQSLPAHLQLLAASEDHPGDTLREI